MTPLQPGFESTSRRPPLGELGDPYEIVAPVGSVTERSRSAVEYQRSVTWREPLPTCSSPGRVVVVVAGGATDSGTHRCG
ncbi:MAG: hypothetical protein M5T61_11530 [Acidimicrobiia bacterium]|nr:hypothetical protein [Acidimicrobiia bacterium]